MDDPRSRPRLTLAGQAILGGGVCLLFIAGTSGQALPAGLAALPLGLLAFALLDVKRRTLALADLHLKLPREAEPSPRRNRPWPLAVRLVQGGRQTPGRVILRVEASAALGQAEPVALDIPARAAVEAHIDLPCPRAGHWRVHGLRLDLTDPLGLVQGHHHRPLERPVDVHPAAVPSAAVARLIAPVGARRSREGRHLNRMRGTGLELMELRDYVPGDPLKAVAWKATARRGRPQVKVFEEETLRRVQLLVDIGPTLRAGELGQTPLDAVVDTCAALINACPDDRVGLTTYDTRVYGHLKPGRGRPHRQRLIRHLMDLASVVDEDLTEITEAELMARVGGFLERQEGLTLTHLATDPTRQMVARTLVDPLRELFDEGALFAEVTRALSEDRHRGHATLFAKARPAEALLSARLRLFCALRGLDLPYRISGDPRDAGRGLMAAIQPTLRPGGAQTLLVLSDLRALTPDGPGVSALGLAAAHQKRVLLINPSDQPTPEAVQRAVSRLGASVRFQRFQRPPAQRQVARSQSTEHRSAP